MIQDIEPYRLANEFEPVPPEPEDYILWYKDDHILLRHSDEAISFPRFADISSDKTGRYAYLFTVGENTFYLSEAPEAAFGEEFYLENIQALRRTSPRHLTYAGLVGYQLYNWYRNRHFCGRCGKPMKPATNERMLYCPECGNLEYPKISPAVIVALTDGDRILMSKYAGRAFKKYALLAGFAEIGETIEETIRREIMEEVGLKVKNLRYYKSQPWPYSDSLLFGFFAELDGEDTITLDENELAVAEWFTRSEMPVEADGFSLTNEMMMQFKNGRF